MLDKCLIRLVDGQLAWYPPGAPQGPEALDSDAALERLWQFVGTSRLLCFAVPGVDVTLFKLQFTKAEKKHIGRALPYAMEERLASDIDTLHFASTELADNSLCAAVSARQKMLDWTSMLIDCPPVAQWVPEPMLLPWRSGEWTIVMEQGQAIVRLSECEGFTIELALLAPMLEGAVHDAGEAPATVIVYGGNQSSDSALLPETLRHLMAWRAGGLPAAMLLGSANDVSLNLLQGEFGHRLPLQRWWTQWRAVAVILLAAFTLQLVANYATYLSLAKENVVLRQGIESSYRRAFPQGALVDAEKQVRRQLDVLQGTAQSSGFVSLMGRVGAIIAQQPGTEIDSINYSDKGGEMRLNITAEDFAAVEGIRTAMTAAGLEAVMENSNVQGDKVRARLRVGDGQ